MRMWIEMSRDEEHGGKEWGFTKCIWAPTYKKSKGEDKSWPFWNNVNKVRAGDIVLHLRGKGQRAEFVGCSFVKTNGHETLERPPIPGSWGYCKSFYRAFLGDYIKFNQSINLYHLFKDKNILKGIMSRRPNHEISFYTIQSDRLQCLNGDICLK